MVCFQYFVPILDCHKTVERNGIVQLKSQEYRRTILTHVQNIFHSGKPALISGAGRAGWYIMRVLEFHGVTIAGFVDNDLTKRTGFCGYPVILPKEITLEPKPYLFLGVFLPKTGAAIRSQFESAGIREVFFDTAAFLYSYLVDVAGRNCDNETLAQSIFALFDNYLDGSEKYGFSQSGFFVSPFVTSVITQKCSLRCRDCAQLIPYYQKPVHFTPEVITRDIRRYASAFDVVPEISLHGGEPFLHPDLPEICRQVSEVSNVVFISFVTNGTILPSEETLKALADCGADVHISGGYGDLSTRREELAEALRRHGVYSDTLFCLPTEMWSQPAPVFSRARLHKENDAMYNLCVSTTICCQLMNGELHRCPLSMHATNQGKVPKNADDFVVLNTVDSNREKLICNIRSLVTRTEALTVCDYCDPESTVSVTPAVQLQQQNNQTGRDIGNG